jgi:hypothetical protein
VKRLLALGLGFAVSGVVLAQAPVSVHPPTAPTAQSGLNQSLPSAIQSAAPAGAPPVMSSTPSWLPGTLVPSSTPIPTVGPNYLTPAPAAAAGCATPGCTDCTTGVRPHFNLLARPGWLGNRGDCGTCSTRGSCMDQFKAWLGFRTCESDWHRTANAYRAPLRWYTTNPACPVGGCNIPTTCDTGNCSTGTCATGTCAPERPGLVNRVRTAVAKPGCDVTIRTTPLPTESDNCSTCRPRVLYVPLNPRADVTPTYGCADAQPSRPSLLRRMLAYVIGWELGHDKGGFGCDSGNCPPPPPSPVRYAAPCAVPPAPSLQYSQQARPIWTPAAQPVPTAPALPVPTNTAVPGPKNISVTVPTNTTVPTTKAGPRPLSATQPFTNQ